MKTALVGYTGFVGSNIAAAHPFDGLYNSKNIKEAFGQMPELLIYAGLPAAKFLANKAPEQDMAVCNEAFANIKAIAPQRLVLISTVDVYKTPCEVDENTPILLDDMDAYGKNRARLEQMVRSEYPDALIVRLPGLFGFALKKNFIFDIITVTPSMLKTEKYEELSKTSPLVQRLYTKSDNGFYKLCSMNTEDKNALRAFFAGNNFNALSFTDYRAEYQFYNLANLWRDLAWALAANITLLNIAAEPVSAGELYSHITKGGVFENKLATAPVRYDMRSKYSALYHGENGYLYTKQEILEDIAMFVRQSNV
ncbi:MAG: NAD(P)-dependent oxidoreductase [Oscillospiraceae bacterium]